MSRALPSWTTIKRYLGSFSIAVVGLVLMVVIVATGPVTEPEDSGVQPPLVRFVEVRPGLVRLTVAAHGVVVPKTESRLVAEVSGRIVSVADSMVSGGFFRRDDVLVTIDRVDYELALEQARARLSSATSELAQARRALARQDRLTETDAVSKSNRDEAENRQLLAEASFREATAQEKRAERDLERTRVVAPYDGRVRSELVDPGQFVNRGETLANLYSVDVAEVRLPVHDEDLAFLPVSLGGALDPAARLNVGLRARFAGREHEWRGRIVRTEGEIDPGTRMVKMIAEVQRPYDQAEGKPPLTVGLFVDAEIEGREVGNAVVLPRAALQSEAHVHVIEADDRLAVREVEVLRLLGEEAYVLGLRRGERVSLTRLPGAAEGLRVRTAGNGGALEGSP
ncbi:MAG: efflux RND transporter periplasmic adaptor subunit [Gammaproteobacteria bacterium]|nr:efflux RND transporter periplasmic adaptor subunit [Gammaproteobacteria bacterium]